MANLMIPEGYEKLAAIGIAYKGGYEASKAYGILNAVYHNGSTFVSLKDGPEGEPTGDGVNWQYMAKGFVEGLLSAVQAKDTSGIIGTAGQMVNAQSLLDVIADRVANKLINKNKIVNNLTSTDVSAVLAAPQGKTLKDEIGEVNRKLNDIKYVKPQRINDLNAPLESENIIYFYSYTNTALNAPSPTYGILISIYIDSLSFCIQFALDLNGGSYTRVKTASAQGPVWSEWLVK